ncbi:MAG: MTH938/NDUFAF3 family protein [Anaerolineales bacterium]
MASPEIQHYEFGHIEIDGDVFHNDVIIFPDHVQTNWWREEGHSLVMSDLDTVVGAGVKQLIIGQGANGRMSVPADILRSLEMAGIEVRAVRTPDAVDLYNRLRERGDVAAALHLTC